MLGLVQVFVHGGAVVGAMPEEVSQLREAIRGLPGGVLNRVTHQHAVDLARCKRRYLAAQGEKKTAQRQVDRERALRKGFRKKPLLESLFRARAGALQSCTAIQRALAEGFVEPRPYQHLRAHPALLLDEVLVYEWDPSRRKVERDKRTFLQESVELRAGGFEFRRQRMCLELTPGNVYRWSPAPRLVLFVQVGDVVRPYFRFPIDDVTHIGQLAPFFTTAGDHRLAVAHVLRNPRIAVLADIQIPVGKSAPQIGRLALDLLG